MNSAFFLVLRRMRAPIIVLIVIYAIAIFGLTLVPGDATLRRTLARDLSSLAQYDEAIAVWSALIEENPQDTQALMGRVQTHVAQGQAARALPDTTALLTEEARLRYS